MPDRKYHVKFKDSDGNPADATFSKKAGAMQFVKMIDRVGGVISHDIDDTPEHEMSYIERMLASENFKAEYPVWLAIAILEFIDFISQKMDQEFANEINSLIIQPFNTKNLGSGYRVTMDTIHDEALVTTLHERNHDK